MAELPPDTELGSQGPRYRIKRLLSRSTNGVYEAETLGPLSRTVAIKQLVQHSVAIQEATTLSRIKHPAIPFLIEYFTERDYSYIVMEFVAGETLGD